jgi:hypothetical protein
VKHTNEILVKAQAFIDTLGTVSAEIGNNIQKSGMALSLLAKELARWMEFFADFWCDIIQKTLDDNDFKRKEKIYARRLGYKIDRYSKVTITVPGGKSREIMAAWYVKAKSKGRTKRGPKKQSSSRKGCYVGLELLGIQYKLAPDVLSQSLRLVALLPYETASDTLASNGIKLSASQLHRVVGHLDDLSMEERAALACKRGECWKGRRLLICLDGGRARRRRDKAGRIPKDQKRRGFTADWKEPRLFTIYVIDEQGKPDANFEPICDGLLDQREQLAELLSAYLKQLGVDASNEIIVAADGGDWIDTVCEASLTDDLKLKYTRILDYTHAKQAVLGLIQEHCLELHREGLKQTALDLLWSGDHKGLENLLCASAAGRPAKAAIKTKIANYLASRPKEIAYAEFKSRGIPTGSGHVESAIRRVLNLRIKAPGSFWAELSVDTMILIRSNALYGRWNSFMHNMLFSEMAAANKVMEELTA